MKFFVLFATLLVAVAAQRQQLQQTTPVPILRQVNSHNDDGSYTYGYEAADGSYKIETKAATGEVRGKYGYVDTNGALREVEYGANRNGFNPSGTGISVPAAAPAKSNIQSTNPADYDDGQYRPGPDEAGLGFAQEPAQQQASPLSRLSGARRFSAPRARPQQQQQQQTYVEETQQDYEPQQPQPYHQQQQQYQQQQIQYQQQQQQYQRQQQQYQQNLQQYQPQPAYQPVQLPQNAFNGHPARSIDINTGSYSLQY